MNTKFKISRQVVLTISVLLTAMWLPLTTSAQDFSKTDDFAQSAITPADNCVHCQTMHDSQDLRNCQHSHDALTFSLVSYNRLREGRVGFAETDPAVQQSGHVAAAPPTLSHQVQKVTVGFAETDPANHQSLESVTVAQAANNRAQQAFVGFSETDPAATIYQYFGEIVHLTLKDCLNRNANGIALKTPEISSLTENIERWNQVTLAKTF